MRPAIPTSAARPAASPKLPSQSPSSSATMSSHTNVAVIGCGTIAPRHFRAITRTDSLKLVATADPNKDRAFLNTRHFKNNTELFTHGGAKLYTVATPSGYHSDIAKDALRAGGHVVLEKPPTQNVRQLQELAEITRTKRRFLATLWHSAHVAAVCAVRERLHSSAIASIEAIWWEDFHKYHNGASWLMELNNGGIMDPQINCLSIIQRIVGDPVFDSATVNVPSNWTAPISGTFKYHINHRRGGEVPVSIDAGWRAGGHDEWSITIKTTNGNRIKLTAGGARWSENGRAMSVREVDEYVAGYAWVADKLECFRRGETVNTVINSPLACFEAVIGKMRRNSSSIQVTSVSTFSVNRGSCNASHS